MEHTIRATDLARNLGDVLSTVRYRRDSFVVRRYGRPVARVVPIEDETEGATVGEALSNWCGGAESDPAFATTPGDHERTCSDESSCRLVGACRMR